MCRLEGRYNYKIFITCLFQTHLQHDSRNTQVVFTLETFNTDNKKDIPPDYNTVVKMKEDEEEGLPSYSQAVAINLDKNISNFAVLIISETEVSTAGNINTNDQESDTNAYSDADENDDTDSSEDSDE